MNEPDWFVLLNAWTSCGMGTRGPTLAYLVGALARRRQFRLDESEIVNLLRNMADRPVPEHVVQVSWCSTISEPVLSLHKVSTPEPSSRRYAWAAAARAQRPPLEFSGELLTNHGLGCTSPEEGMRRLAAEAMDHIKSGHFSRKLQSSGLYEYEPFTAEDLAFIDRTLRPQG